MFDSPSKKRTLQSLTVNEIMKHSCLEYSHTCIDTSDLPPVLKPSKHYIKIGEGGITCLLCRMCSDGRGQNNLSTTPDVLGVLLKF
jgi:hypothetical protein